MAMNVSIIKPMMGKFTRPLNPQDKICPKDFLTDTFYLATEDCPGHKDVGGHYP